MNMWRLLSTALCAGAFAFAGCGDNGGGSTSQPQGNNSGGGTKHIMIGIVAKSISNPVFQAAHAGAQDAAAELGSQYGVTIEVNIQTPTDENAQKQAEAVENLTRLGAAGIAVSCSEANTLQPAIDAAVDKGVPVVCFDSDSPKSKRFAYYGTDDEACGRLVMNLLAKSMDDKGVVAILAGNQNAPNLQNRVQGVRDELKNHPNIKEVTTGAVYFEETPVKAAEKLQEVQRANPEITGWAMIGGWPLFTHDALPWKAGDVKVVAVDALPAELTYLKSGHVQVLLAQDCYGWGYKSVKLLLDKIVKNETPKETRVVDALAQVGPNDTATWEANWKKWLKQ